MFSCKSIVVIFNEKILFSFKPIYKKDRVINNTVAYEPNSIILFVTKEVSSLSLVDSFKFVHNYSRLKVAKWVDK